MGIMASIGNIFKGKNNKEQERMQAFEKQREEENKTKITYTPDNQENQLNLDDISQIQI